MKIHKGFKKLIYTIARKTRFLKERKEIEEINQESKTTLEIIMQMKADLAGEDDTDKNWFTCHPKGKD